jgi:diacylglycerol kinase family enzyme
MGKTRPMRLALVANEAAGAGLGAEAVTSRLRAEGARVSVHDVADPAVAAGAGPDRIVVAGGDGSVGPAAEVAAGAGVPLAVVPTGTANDFARSLGLPLDIGEACALAASPAAHERPVDVARADGRPFVNAASAGLSVVAATRARPLKPSLGPLAYAIGAVRAGLTARPLACRAVVDGDLLFDGRAWQVIVAGTGAFGGGSEVEEADAADRLLDVAVLEAGPRPGLVRRAWGMRRGGLVEQPGVIHGRGRVVEVAGDAVGDFNVDGEVCTLRPARFETGRERVRVICP